MDRTRLTVLMRAHGPRILLAYGLIRGVLVGALAPLFGLPMWIAILLAALWAAGPAIGAFWWTARMVREGMPVSDPLRAFGSPRRQDAKTPFP